MWYSVDGLPRGANAAAFCPPPPPVVTDAADSSMGIVTRTVTLLRAVPAPPPSAIACPGISADPGAEIGVLAQMVYVGRPTSDFCSLVPIRPNEMIPVPAVTPNANQQAATTTSRRNRFLGKGQIGWTRAFQRWPNVAGS